MNDFLAVVSYPEIQSKEKAWIDAYREKYDTYYGFVDAHFTLVFPLENYPIGAFSKEIEKQTINQKIIHFSIHCATRNNDLTSDLWHVFLVPDEGFSEIVKLHDKLYSGALAEYERLDLDFIPHIGVGNSKDPKECKRMIDEINSMNIEMKGAVSKLQLIRHEKGIIHTFHEIELEK